jgi:hypothetical protein
MKNILIGVVALFIVGLLAFLMLSDRATAPEDTTDLDQPMPVEPDGGIGDDADPLDQEAEEVDRAPQEVIGKSVDGADIMAYHFGTGNKEILFVGGIHNGFAPNTVAVAEELISELEAGDISIPQGLMVTVIPNLNPDATNSPNTLAGRLNKNGVDLNRNFDCEWNTQGTWNNTPVSGGSAPFSEPEADAVRDYVNANRISGAVVYYAADGGVYASNCGGTLSAEISTLTEVYAEASGYTANDEFNAYKISGDMTNWLAKNNIPTIGVLLSNYTSTEWPENKAGIEAVLNYFAN